MHGAAGDALVCCFADGLPIGEIDDGVVVSLFSIARQLTCDLLECFLVAGKERDGSAEAGQLKRAGLADALG